MEEATVSLTSIPKVSGFEPEDQMPNLDELRAICNLNTEEQIQIKIEPTEPAYLDDNDYEEEACPENIVIKPEPYFFNNADNDYASPSDHGEEQDLVNTKLLERKIKQESDDDDDYIPMKKPIVKPKSDPATTKKRDRKKKRPTNKNLHSYNALTNIEVVSISEVERRDEHKSNLLKKSSYVYRCDNCAMGFISRKAYDKHMECHSARPGFEECELCHTYLKSAEMLYQHKLRHYRRYRCLLCGDGQNYKDRETVACHIRTVHEKDRFPCEYCAKSFKRPAYLKNHVEQHHTKPVTLACPHCGQVFHQRNWYRWHLRKHDDQEVKQPPPSAAYTCQLCFQRLRSRRELAGHAARAHAGLQYQLPETRRNKRIVSHCEPCGRYFGSKELLNHHDRRMHRDRTKHFQCDYCKRFYLTKSEVRSHIEWSHQRSPASGFLCHCGRQFRAPGLLRRHERRAHGGEPPPPRDRPCPQCGKQFTSEQAVRRHMRSHLGLKYPCAQCEEQFCSPQYARTHFMLRHLNMTRAEIRARARDKKIANGHIPKEEPTERDKACPDCGKTYSTNQAVKRHQKSHQGVKYPCAECGETFSSSTYAKIHYQLRHLQMTRAEIRANTQANKKRYARSLTKLDTGPGREGEVFMRDEGGSGSSNTNSNGAVEDPLA